MPLPVIRYPFYQSSSRYRGKENANCATNCEDGEASKQAHRAGCISHDKRNCTVTERQLTAPFSRTNGPALPVSSPLPVHGQTRNGVDGAHGGVAVDALYLSVILRGPASPMQIRQRWITHSMHKL